MINQKQKLNSQTMISQIIYAIHLSLVKSQWLSHRLTFLLGGLNLPLISWQFYTFTYAFCGPIFYIFCLLRDRIYIPGVPQKMSYSGF